VAFFDPTLDDFEQQIRAGLSQLALGGTQIHLDSKVCATS
jgi:hypothetical protein